MNTGVKLITLEPKEKKIKKNDKKAKKKRKKEISKEIVIYTKKVLDKILNGMKKDTNSTSFQDIRLYNLVIYDKNGKSIKMFPGAIDRAKLKHIRDEYKDASVMVSVSGGYFKLLPIDTLVKLSKIKKMVLTDTVIAYPDGDDEFVLYDKHYDITTANQLLKTLLVLGITEDTVVDLQSRDYWYWTFEYINRVMIEYKDGTRDYYSDTKDKKCFVDFLSDFYLTTFLR